MKIHRFQLEGKLNVAAVALGLDVETLRAAVTGLLDVQEPRPYDLIIPARDFRFLPHHAGGRWRYVWKVPDALRDAGFNVREAQFTLPTGVKVETLFLAANEMIIDVFAAPADLQIPVLW